MADARSLRDDFAARFEAGEDPDPRDYLERAGEAQRQELASLIDRYLMTAPRRPWDPVAYESSGAKAAVERVYESLEGVSGTWPELLPTLRNKARIKRSDLVRRLTEALGFGAGEAQVQKVGVYYHRMEHGSLPAEGVSSRVLDALAGIVGVSAEAIRRAGSPPAAAGGGEAVAFARITRLASDSPATLEHADFERADLGVGSAPAERDEIDRLFTEG